MEAQRTVCLHHASQCADAYVKRVYIWQLAGSNHLLRHISNNKNISILTTHHFSFASEDIDSSNWSYGLLSCLCVFFKCQLWDSYSRVLYGLKVTYMDTRIIFLKISYVHFLKISRVQERKSYTSGLGNERSFIFGWSIPLMSICSTLVLVYSNYLWGSVTSFLSLVHSIINARCFGVFSVEMGWRDGLFGCRLIVTMFLLSFFKLFVFCHVTWKCPSGASFLAPEQQSLSKCSVGFVSVKKRSLFHTLQ